ncbi:FidL-like protein, partial [Klebsiella pneumoniae]
NGSMVVEGYTDSAAGWLYLQRYVKFSYTSQRISATERHYRIKKWESSASSIDESPNVIFDYFMREMSDSHDGLFLNAQKLNDKAILLSSINSPLYICTLKSGSTLN